MVLIRFDKLGGQGFLWTPQALAQNHDCPNDEFVDVQIRISALTVALTFS